MSNYQNYADDASAAAAQARGDYQSTTTGYAPDPASNPGVAQSEERLGDAAAARDQAKSGIQLGHVLDDTDPNVARRREQLAAGQAATAARGINEPSVTGRVPDPASNRLAGDAAEAEAESRRTGEARAAGIQVGHEVPNPGHVGSLGFGGTPGFAGNNNPSARDYENLADTAAGAARGQYEPTVTGAQAPAPASSAAEGERGAAIGDANQLKEQDAAGIRVGRVLD